ncbi:MAG: hypothetical protein HOO96_34015 [Polyangiaceae bacterium]|nr:hypothetical protein [Polyangiaceae bacterium]
MNLVIIGAGGHGAVCAEAAEAAGHRVLGFVDDVQREGTVLGHPIFAGFDAVPSEVEAYFVAIGQGEARARHVAALRAQGRRVVTLVHPSALVSPSAKLEEGVFVGPFALVHTRAHVAEGAIVNSGAIVEHDARVGRFALLASGIVVGPGESVPDFEVRRPAAWQQ